jgi:adenylyl- and sulfurtransferase ThiI
LLGTTVVRWSGRGRLDDLIDSIEAVMRAEDERARVISQGNSVLVEGAEPAGVASLLGGLPGIEWIAIGSSSDSVRGLAAALAKLARKYVTPQGRFVVRAESTSDMTKPSDLAGAGTSAVLDAARGSRASESAASTIFRVAFDGKHGVAAVEIGRGPGGSAMGRRVASCLVSGGMHSSALVWAAMLSGYSVRMVHSKVSEDSLMAVARLYALLSQRVDPRKVSLTVLEGGGVLRSLSRWSSRAGGSVFAGFHAECHAEPVRIAKNVESPLFLLPEEEFERFTSTIGAKVLDGRERWGREQGGRVHVTSIGGVRRDVHGVLDGLRKSPRRF